MAIITLAVPVLYNTMSICDPNWVEQQDMRSWAMRAFTLGIFGFSMSQDDQFTPFVYQAPTSNGDRLSGGICSVTGFWSSGSSMVDTARGKAIKEFAGYDHPGDNK